MYHIRYNKVYHIVENSTFWRVLKLVTRKDKRKLEGNTNYFFEFLKIKEHFFKGMNLWLKKVKDHRHQSYKKYDTDVILFMVIFGDFKKCIQS
jgi:hypothetical protein